MYETNCGIAGSKASDGIRWNKITGRSKSLTQKLSTPSTAVSVRSLTEGTEGFSGMHITLKVMSRYKHSYNTMLQPYAHARKKVSLDEK
jgi:hypothetical protein